MATSRSPHPGDLVVAVSGDGCLVVRAGAARGQIVAQRSPWWIEDALAFATREAARLGVDAWFLRGTPARYERVCGGR